MYTFFLTLFFLHLFFVFLCECVNSKNLFNFLSKLAMNLKQRNVIRCWNEMFHTRGTDSTQMRRWTVKGSGFTFQRVTSVDCIFQTTDCSRISNIKRKNTHHHPHTFCLIRDKIRKQHDSLLPKLHEWTKCSLTMTTSVLQKNNTEQLVYPDHMKLKFSVRI